MKVKPVLRFRAGMKVRFVNSEHTIFAHNTAPYFYPSPGKTGVIKAFRQNADKWGVLVKWESGSTSESDEWWCESDDIEAIE